MGFHLTTLCVQELDMQGVATYCGGVPTSLCAALRNLTALQCMMKGSTVVQPEIPDHPHIEALGPHREESGCQCEAAGEPLSSHLTSLHICKPSPSYSKVEPAE